MMDRCSRPDEPRTPRILIIERDPDLRELFQTLFENDTVYLPATQADALRYLDDYIYDVVILDEEETLVITPATAIKNTSDFATPCVVFPKPFSVAQLRWAVHAMGDLQNLS
jgi:CheY-like chemotaxis protein